MEMTIDKANLSVALGKHEITVLLVDDQPIVSEAVRRMLASEKDIVFHYCQDPTAAIKMATNISPTVILQDLVMPEVDGLTLVRFFRAHQKLRDVPLIVLSSKEEAVTKAEAFEKGANDYLVKLPDRIELIARIRYHSTGYINLLQRNEAYEALFKSRQLLSAQLASAAEYVVSLLPRTLKEGNIRTDWRYFPSAQLGGDSLGYHWIDEHHFAMYLLDVCDHGVGPALLSVSVLNVLRSQTLPHTDFRNPEEVLARLNETFPMEKQNNLFFSLWYGVFNKATGKITYGCAGHPPALLMSSASETKDLGTKNMFIGGMPDITYTSESVNLEMPSRLYIFSDGIFEIAKTDGTMWSFEEMKGFLEAPAMDETPEMDRLYSFVREMHGGEGLDDDFSMLKIEFIPN
ncbi:MAG: SpoIIE family protein phosphatase [Desulfobacterales bacterium]|nr:SpoIIE family protein phosphatase [Desulfobacterales bacterium]